VPNLFSQTAVHHNLLTTVDIRYIQTTAGESPTSMIIDHVLQNMSLMKKNIDYKRVNKFCKTAILNILKEM